MEKKAEQCSLSKCFCNSLLRPRALIFPLFLVYRGPVTILQLQNLAFVPWRSIAGPFCLPVRRQLSHYCTWLDTTVISRGQTAAPLIFSMISLKLCEKSSLSWSDSLCTEKQQQSHQKFQNSGVFSCQVIPFYSYWKIHCQSQADTVKYLARYHPKAV